MSYEEKIYQLELSLLKQETRKSLDALNRLLADNFMEFGSSGRIYYKKDVINDLLLEQVRKFTVENFKVVQLATNVVLVTYRTIDDKGTSLRSSIWKLNDNSWQMVFHQGTKQT